MTSEYQNSEQTGVTARVEVPKRAKAKRPQDKRIRKMANSCSLRLVESGEWLSAETMQGLLITALKRGATITLDVSGIDFMPGSVLQLLIAMHVQSGREGQANPRLSGVSAELARWFGYAGTSFLVGESSEGREGE